MTKKDHPIPVLTEEQWEERLRAHYLSSDGPYGSSPITYIDASPSELRIAAGLHGFSEKQVAKSFCSIFNRENVKKVFDTYASNDDSINDRFKFLILSCFVIATTEDAGKSRNYRQRLGCLLDHGGQVQSVKNINILWETFQKINSKKISNGEDLRHIVLPDFGRMNQIGYAVKLAYPSLGDRAKLYKIISGFDEEYFDSIFKIINEVFSYKSGFSDIFRGELEGFYQLYEKKGVLASQHKFWLLVEKIISDLKGDKDNSFIFSWKLTASFYGFDNDLEFDCVSETSKNNFRQLFHGDFKTLLKSTELPKLIYSYFQRGFIFLFNDGKGGWETSDKISGKNTKECIVISNINSHHVHEIIKRDIDLGDGWFVTQPLLYSRARQAFIGKSIVFDTEKLVSIDGGVKVKRNIWLGRAAFLPYIAISDGVELILEPSISTTCDTLSLEKKTDGTYHLFSSDNTFEGTWRLTAKVDSYEEIHTIRFQYNTNLNSTVFNAVNFSPIPEICDKQELGKELEVKNNNIHGFDVISEQLMDLIEALYTYLPSGIKDSELKNLIGKVGGKDNELWSVIRSLEEAGIIAQLFSKNWKGRIWQVLPPKILMIDKDYAHIEGCIPHLLLHHIKAYTERSNLNFYIIQSEFKPPVLSVKGSDILKLAYEYDLNIEWYTPPKIEKAPLCWPITTYSHIGRERVGIWNGEYFDKKIELANNSLERLVSSKQCDVYMINSNGHNYYYENRVPALLEYYRSIRESAFYFENNRLITKRNVFLPVPIARWLRLNHHNASGLTEDAKYKYPCSKSEYEFLAFLIGFDINSNNHLIKNISLKRHRKNALLYRG